MAKIKGKNLIGNKYNSTYLLICLGSSLFTLILVYIVFMISGLAPFGNRTLTYSDGQFQMIDLLSWYKDVLAGKADIDYSMGKSLGGSTFAVFTYYLASPVNLLMVFFDKGSSPLFMNIIFTLKSMLASGFMAYYLLGRFKPCDKSRYAMTLILAVSYGLCPFMLAQSSNTMWLDGAYMLPLILSGCERIVQRKSGALFAVSTALAIIFNWYTGIIDLLFACFWFLFELIRELISGRYENKVRSILMTIARYAVYFAIAVVMSSAVLMPTLYMLSTRTHGASGLGMLKDLGFIGNVTDAIYNYSFGTISLEGSASLFTGTFVLIGVIMFFVNGAAEIKQKLLNGGALLFAVLMFFWQPLVALFSLLRVVESYWYRYTYMGSFVLIFLAASYYLASARRPVKPWVPLLGSVGFCATVVVISLIKTTSTSELVFAFMFEDLTGVYIDQDLIPALAKLIFPMLVSLIMLLVLAARKENPIFTRVMTGVLVIVISAELVMGLTILGRFYSVDNAQYLRDYAALETASLPEDDNGFYRVVQTSYHSYHLGSPSSYNEAMAYGFNSVVSFVSDPDEDAVMFLDRAGYPEYSETITVTASENLATDSLLGVRYVLLPYDDDNNEGLVMLDTTDGFKTLYMNPYAAPVAFTYEGTGDYDSSETIPALYLNDIYRTLTGVDDDIFRQVPFTCEKSDSTWQYQAPAVNGILYAGLVTNTDDGATLYVNGEEYLRYSSFLAPVEIRVPVNDEEAVITIEFDGNNTDAEVIRADFYELDLSVLKEETDIMIENGCLDSLLTDGDCRFEVEGRDGRSLFVSIPYDEGWTVTRNGEEVTPDIFGGTFMSIPLVEGHNTIEMNYKVPYKSAGMIISVAGVLAGALYIILERRKLNRQEVGS